MKRISIFLLSVLVIALFALAAFAASGRQVYDGDGIKIPGAVYDGGATKIISKGRALYTNFSTSGKTFFSFAAHNGGTAKAVKVRLGGYATGSETDVMTSTGRDIVLDGQTKVGFQNYTTGTDTYINTWTR